MLSQTINNDLNSALKSGNSFEVQVLRGVNAALKNKAIEKRGRGESEELSDGEVVDVLGRELKKRREAAELYKQGNRPDLADKEEKEAMIISRFLPKQLHRQEIEKIVDEVLADAGDKSFGAVMKAAMARLKGQADGKLVAEIIKEKLA